MRESQYINNISDLTDEEIELLTDEDIDEIYINTPGHLPFGTRGRYFERMKDKVKDDSKDILDI